MTVRNSQDNEESEVVIGASCNMGWEKKKGKGHNSLTDKHFRSPKVIPGKMVLFIQVSVPCNVKLQGVTVL